MTGRLNLLRPTLAVSAALVAAASAVAVGVRLLWASGARDTLAFGFAGLDPDARTALSILAANARLLAALMAACAAAQILWRLRPAGGQPGLTIGVARATLDTLVALQVTANIAVVGAAVGGYGDRMLAAMLPHGPLELLAFAAPLALYLHARRARTRWTAVLVIGMCALSVLACAAVLETFVVA